MVPTSVAYFFLWYVPPLDDKPDYVKYFYYQCVYLLFQASLSVSLGLSRTWVQLSVLTEFESTHGCGPGCNPGVHTGVESGLEPSCKMGLMFCRVLRVSNDLIVCLFVCLLL